VVTEEIYALYVEVGSVYLLRNAYLALLGCQVGKSTLDRLFHCSFDTPSYL